MADGGRSTGRADGSAAQDASDAAGGASRGLRSGADGVAEELDSAVRPGADQEHPASVAWVSRAIHGWIKRLGDRWIEGQIAQLNHRRDAAYLTLRDLAEESSLPVFAPQHALRQVPDLAQGDHVIIRAVPEFWVKRGSLQLRAIAIRKVGLGELLAQLERLRQALEAEGLFRPERKRPLPFLPQRVGLISGRNSDAERDVITNARNRWPGLPFEVRSVPVQGPRAVSEVSAALRELDALPGIDVIVIARGGGSVEDLLPFSNETLVRAVAAAGTPVVSAIGHERDSPLLDLVADLRASTPTDAGKRIVPDLAEQIAGVRDLRVRGRRALRNRLQHEAQVLQNLRIRPVLAEPTVLLAQREQAVAELADRARRSLTARVDHDLTEISHLRSRVRALSPLATLERGYAIVQTSSGDVVRAPSDAEPGAVVRIRVARGRFSATVTEEAGVQP